MKDSERSVWWSGIWKIPAETNHPDDPKDPVSLAEQYKDKISFLKWKLVQKGDGTEYFQFMAHLQPKQRLSFMQKISSRIIWECVREPKACLKALCQESGEVHDWPKNGKAPSSINWESSSKGKAKTFAKKQEKHVFEDQTDEESNEANLIRSGMPSFNNYHLAKKNSEESFKKTRVCKTHSTNNPNENIISQAEKPISKRPEGKDTNGPNFGFDFLLDLMNNKSCPFATGLYDDSNEQVAVDQNEKISEINATKPRNTIGAYALPKDFIIPNSQIWPSSTNFGGPAESEEYCNIECEKRFIPGFGQESSQEAPKFQRIDIVMEENNKQSSQFGNLFHSKEDLNEATRKSRTTHSKFESPRNPLEQNLSGEDRTTIYGPPPLTKVIVGFITQKSLTITRTAQEIKIKVPCKQIRIKANLCKESADKIIDKLHERQDEDHLRNFISKNSKIIRKTASQIMELLSQDFPSENDMLNKACLCNTSAEQICLVLATGEMSGGAKDKKQCNDKDNDDSGNYARKTRMVSQFSATNHSRYLSIQMDSFVDYQGPKNWLIQNSDNHRKSSKLAIGSQNLDVPCNGSEIPPETTACKGKTTTIKDKKKERGFEKMAPSLSPFQNEKQKILSQKQLYGKKEESMENSCMQKSGTGEIPQLNLPDSGYKDCAAAVQANENENENENENKKLFKVSGHENTHAKQEHVRWEMEETKGSNGHTNPIKSCHAEGVAKVVLKATTKEIAKRELGSKLLLQGAGKYLLSTQVAENVLKSGIVTKVVGKSAGEMIGKKVPLLSFVLGFGFGIQRFLNGQWVKGGLEIVSGTLACAPGYGTAASIGLDGIILAHDISLTVEERDKVIGQTTFESYEILGLQEDATKQEVSLRASQLVMEFHPDKASDHPDFTREQLKEFCQAINAARDWIFQQKKWE